MSLKSKKVIVTGASSGIGKAIAEKLSAEGAEVLLAARREELLKTVCNEILVNGGSARYIKCDLSDEKQRKIFCGKVSEIWPQNIDIIVNAAGIHKLLPVAKSSAELWREIFEVNVFAAADLLAILLPKINEGGSVVNIASVAGLMASPGSAVYAASKAALLSFTKTAAVELAPKKIRINAVVPGFVNTALVENMMRFYTKDQQDELKKKHLLGFGTIGDVAASVAFIVSDDAKWITGSSLVLDGGFTLR